MRTFPHVGRYRKSHNQQSSPIIVKMCCKILVNTPAIHVRHYLLKVEVNNAFGDEAELQHKVFSITYPRGRMTSESLTSGGCLPSGWLARTG